MGHSFSPVNIESRVSTVALMVCWPRVTPVGFVIDAIHNTQKTRATSADPNHQPYNLIVTSPSFAAKQVQKTQTTTSSSSIP